MQSESMEAFQRIMIFGPPGGGKTTVALRLSKELDLPVYHLDKHFFVENWVPRQREDFLKIQKTLVENDRWIIDGNALGSLEVRYARADLVIYYAPSRLWCLWGIFKRTFWDQRDHIDDRAPFCHERVTWGLLKYMWKFDQRIAPLLDRLKREYPHVRFVQTTCGLRFL